MATLYWNPAAAANFNATNAWATTYNGTPNQTFATGDIAVFTSYNSNQCTLTASVSVATIDFSGGGYGAFTGTFVHNSSVTLTSTSSVIMSAGMTLTLGSTSTSIISFNASSGTLELTSAGKTFGRVNIFPTSSTGTVRLNDELTANTIYHTYGTFDTNTQTVTVSSYNATTSGTKTITITNSTINITAVSSTSGWNAYGSNTTLNVSGSTINITGSNGYFGGGGKTYNVVNFTGSNIKVIGYADTFSTLSVVNTSSTGSRLELKANITIAAGGELELKGGNDNRYRIMIQSDTVGTQRTITLGLSASTDLVRVDFMDIAFGSSVDFSGITGGCGNVGGCSNITFSTARTLYWYTSTSGTKYYSAYIGTNPWWTGSGGTGTQLSGVDSPLINDNVIFDGSGVVSSTTITMDQPMLGKDFTTSYVNNNPAFFLSTLNYRLFGSMRLGLHSFSGGSSGTFMFHGRGANYYDQGEVTSLWGSIYLYTYGGSMTLLSDLTFYSSTNYLYWYYGDFDADDHSVTAGRLYFYNTSGTINFGSGTWKTLSISGTVITLTSGATYNFETSTIELGGDTTASARTMSLVDGVSLYNLTISGIASSTAYWSLAGSFEVKGMFTIAANNNIRFGGGKTVTLGSSADLSWTGSAGNLINITVLSGTTPWTITRPSGSQVFSCDYLSLTYSTATQSTTFYAGANSTDNGNNSGWVFTGPPAAGGETDGNFFAFF